jgi:hypothetical protein
VPNLYGRKRQDSNRARPAKYKSTYDYTGKVGKENRPTKSFWRENRMEDIIQLTPEEIDARIDIALDNYAERQQKQDPNWWYPEQGKSVTDVRSGLDKENDK